MATVLSRRLSTSLSHLLSRPRSRLSTMAPVTLYTFTTPNGFPISIFLEELKAAYGGPDYEYVMPLTRQIFPF